MKKVNLNKRLIAQWAVFTLLAFWGMVSFLVIAGEDNPNNPLPLAQFFGVKVGAMASLGLCVWVGKIANKHGLIPDEPDWMKEDGE